MRLPALALAAALVACSQPGAIVAPPTVGAHLAATVPGQANVVEFVNGSARETRTFALANARVRAYRVVPEGTAGAVHVTTVPMSAFHGIPVDDVLTADDGSFSVKGIGEGLHVVMLTEEPRRGGCVGQAGMLRLVRVNPGVPTPPISLSY